MYQMIICLISSVLIVLWLYFRWATREIYKALKDVPEIAPFPFIGGARIFLGKSNEAAFTEVTTELPKYGYQPNKCWMGPLCHIIISKPEDVHAIVFSQDCLAKHDVYKNFNHKFGLLTAEPKIWKVHRKMINPTFSLKILQSFIRIFHEKSVGLTNKLSNKVGEGEFNVSKFLFASTLEMTCATTLGYDLNCEEPKNIRYLEATERLSKIFSTRFINFILFSDIVYERTSLYREQKKLLEITYKTANDIIEEQNEAFEEDSKNNMEEDSKPKIFVNQLFKLAKQGLYNAEQIREQVDTILVTGTETTALTISNVLLMLAMHQDIQDRVLTEISQNLVGPIEYEDLPKYVYLEMVIKETMRLIPIAPIFARKCEGYVKLSNCTITPGVRVIVNMYAVHRNPDVWGPNADKFDPDHFLPENVEKRHPCCFLGFSAGPRNCIGAKYAMWSMKIVLVEILKTFKVNTTLKLGDLKFSAEITTKLSNGHMISLENRE